MYDKKELLEPHEKVTLVLIIIVVGFFALMYFMKYKTPTISNYPSERTLVVAFGDSLVEGLGGTNDGFVGYLEELVNYDIENMGKSGETTHDALGRIKSVTDKKPRIVIISLGGNDFIQRRPVSEVKQDLNKVVSQIQDSGSMVVLLGVPGYKDLHKDVASSQNAAYVHNILSGLITNPNYMSDAIHPNDTGYQKIAQKIEPTLEKLLPN